MKKAAVPMAACRIMGERESMKGARPMRNGVALVLLLAVALPSAPLADEQRLQELIAECEACHGPGGVSTEEDIPSLAGQSPARLREILEQFRFYERHCPTTTYRSGDRPRTPANMCGIANSLTEADKEALANHFGSL
jgi:sulfide dehydrogenase cytochrome subunit